MEPSTGLSKKLVLPQDSTRGRHCDKFFEFELDQVNLYRKYKSSH